MTETVQEVFDDLLDSFKDLYSCDEFSYPGVADQEEAEYRERFADALAAEKRSKSTRLSDKKKNCPYCHEDKDWIADNDVIMHYGTDSNGLPILDINDHGHWITTDAIYCQWCGRKLDGWYRFGEK